MLSVRDVEAAVAFYLRLGFTRAWGDDRYAVIRRESVSLHLQWHDASEWSVPCDRPMYRFIVEDPDALFDEFSLAGVVPAGKQVEDKPWGTREFAFYDPDRNGLVFMRDL